jgi:Zn-dependent protease with chaperone function
MVFFGKRDYLVIFKKQEGGEKMKKKIIVFVVLGTIFALTTLPALALETGLEYGTYTGLGTKDIREGVMAIVSILLGFLGIIAILIVLYGGFTWMIAGGNEEKVGQAKKIISAGVIGLVIIFISYAIATFVINQLISATGAV